MKNRKDILRWVPSEVMIFKQKSRQRNLSSPSVTGFSGMENRQELPTDEDFKKVIRMIGEFLEFSSVDLPHVVEIGGQIVCSSGKDGSS